ncbi:hypothetical protein TWF788_007643 [Orbilia oligospora]|uniref:Uncharacterized protein n=1 Tax=Orbilia oligospora TaxID=2813651 RepID=A0A7C8U3J0_ORBOL|nr:hypothetical protein TWF788_007643 [Orbilia oligospora]
MSNRVTLPSNPLSLPSGPLSVPSGSLIFPSTSDINLQDEDDDVSSRPIPPQHTVFPAIELFFRTNPEPTRRVSNMSAPSPNNSLEIKPTDLKEEPEMGVIQSNPTSENDTLASAGEAALANPIPESKAPTLSEEMTTMAKTTSESKAPALPAETVTLPNPTSGSNPQAPTAGTAAPPTTSSNNNGPAPTPATSTGRVPPVQPMNNFGGRTRDVPTNIYTGESTFASIDIRTFGPDTNSRGNQHNGTDGVLQYLLDKSELDNKKALDLYQFELENRKLQLQKEKRVQDVQEASKQRKHELEKMRLEAEIEASLLAFKRSSSANTNTEPTPETDRGSQQ